MFSSNWFKTEWQFSQLGFDTGLCFKENGSIIDRKKDLYILGDKETVVCGDQIQRHYKSPWGFQLDRNKLFSLAS